MITRLTTEVKKHGIELEDGVSKGKLIDELFAAVVEPQIIQPTFVVDYPIELSPLAKKHRTKPGLVERFEGYVLGSEICNAFSELNDPIDQKDRFVAQSRLKMMVTMKLIKLMKIILEQWNMVCLQQLDLGVGVDSLVMLLTNQSSIRDVILFPQMRDEK